MRLINKNDEEMLRTIKFSIKLSDKDKLSGHFKEKAQNGINPADNWFYYGLNAWELMNKCTYSQKKHHFLTEAMKGLDNACAIESQHWPAVFLHSMAMTMLNNDEVEEMCTYLLPTEYTIDDADKDSIAMLDWQKETAQQPYFIIPYLTLATRMLEENETAKALDYINNGLNTITAGEILYLSSLLYIPVIVLYNKLREKEISDIARKIKERYSLLFPHNPI